MIIFDFFFLHALRLVYIYFRERKLLILKEKK